MRGERSSRPYPPGLARVFSRPRPSLELELTRNTKVIALTNHNRSMLCDETSSVPGNYPELANHAHTRCDWISFSLIEKLARDLNANPQT